MLPWGNKSLLGPMLTQIYVTISASIGNNELMKVISRVTKSVGTAASEMQKTLFRINYARNFVTTRMSIHVYHYNRVLLYPGVALSTSSPVLKFWVYVVEVGGLMLKAMASISLMMTSSNGNISALLALCGGIHRSPVNFPHKGQWRGALMFSLICACINHWANNREDVDLRRHYDVIVMLMQHTLWMYV